MSYKQIYNHESQLVTNMIPAETSVNIWGRATGKTLGGTGQKAYFNVVSMPRSVGAIATISFTHFDAFIYGEIIKAWENIGLIEGVDFVVYKEPPTDWPKPYRKITDYKRVISFRNGSAMKIYSYVGKSNGDSIDWLIIEEARLCAKQKIDQTIFCLRGNNEYFGKLAQHHSVSYFTDMPRQPSEFWLLDFEAKMDEDTLQRVHQLLAIEVEYNRKIVKSNSAQLTRNHEIVRDMVRDEINELCKGFTYFSLASSLDNIDALGARTIKNWKNNSASDAEFELSVLNMIPKKVQNCFYDDLDTRIHGRHTPVSRYAAAIDYTQPRNCLWDGDINLDRRIAFGMDNNSTINCIVTGQIMGSNIHILKSMYVLSDNNMKRPDVVIEFDKYYAPLKHLGVDYYYDHTATATDADKTLDDSYAMKTINELKALGWNVRPIFIPQTTHRWRHATYATILKGGDETFPYQLTFNTDNAESWRYSCTQTQTINKMVKGKSSFGKNKKTETDGKTPPQNAPHLSEAGDMLIVGMILSQQSLSESRDIHVG